MTTKLEPPAGAASATLIDALRARMSRALQQVTKELEPRVAAEAVAAPSDALVLVRLLEQPKILALLQAADPLAPARLRGIEARHKLVDLAGGLLSSEEAAAVLGLTRQAVEKRRRAGRLLSVSLGRRGHRYPACQFHDGRALPDLERVLDALKERDPWTQLAFFVNRRTDLGNQSPVARLRKRNCDAVLEAAGADSQQGAA